MTTYSYVLLDNSGSMGPLKHHRDVIAQALLGSANAQNQFGLISFNDRVTINHYFTSNPGELTGIPAHLTPSGLTELWDAMVVALTADIVKPDFLFIVSDGGENASETPWSAFSTLMNVVDPKVQMFKVLPPPPAPVIHPIPPFFVEPPGKGKPLDVIAPKIIDLSKHTDPAKFQDALKRLHDGRFLDLVRH